MVDRDPGTEKYGFIYVLDSGLGYYKIGRSKYLDSRHKKLPIQLPFPVELICIFFSPDAPAKEAELHGCFADVRTNGEWFKLTPADLQHIRITQVLLADIYLAHVSKIYREQGDPETADAVMRLYDQIPFHVIPELPVGARGE